MVPSAVDLGISLGDKVRINKNVLNTRNPNPREQFDVTEIPPPGQEGRVVLTSRLDGNTVVIGSRENVLTEKVEK